jgi:glycosyltransferase involved in cell wall biosynthesis
MLHFVDGNRRMERMRRLTTLLGRRRPDLVHTTLFESDLAGRVAARRTRTPVVSSLVSEHYGPAHLSNPALRRWKLRGAQVVDALTARLAVRLHAVSAHVADTMAHNLRYPRDRIDVVPRGRDPDSLGARTPQRRATAREQLGLAPDARVLLAVARQEHAKGLDVVLEAMPSLAADVDAIHLLVAGQEGGATTDLHALVDRLGLGHSVTFLGGRDDVPDLLCAADVFVLTSRREGSPGSVMEAMALELPIVVTDLPQIREVVNEASAVLVAPSSPPEHLARSIARVFRERGATERRVNVARRRFLADFTIGQVADDMVAFYRRSLASVPRAAGHGPRR